MLQKQKTTRYIVPFKYLGTEALTLPQLTITDYNGFVLSISGEKVVTDVTANDGLWHFICTTWRSQVQRILASHWSEY